MPNNQQIAFYTISSILLAISLILVIIFFKYPIGELFGNAERDLGGFDPSMCGEGTMAIGNMCKPNTQQLVDALIGENYIKITFDQRIYYDPSAKYTEIVDPPTWYARWIDIGGPGVCKRNLDTSDLANPFLGPQSNIDMKYAGTKKNHTCVVGDPQKQSYSVFETDGLLWSTEDICNEGYCYVNGICVSPYKIGDSLNSVNCCPPCIYTPVSQGGCAGKFACDENLPCREEKKVEYPGTQIKCTNPSDYSVAPKCTNDSVTECWDPNHPDDSKKYPYILLSNNNTCQEVSLCDSYNGKNEFECSLTCLEDSLSQKECSKRCLPKLWRWYPVFAQVAGQTRSFRGFMQSDQLMKDLDPKDVPPLKYCPPNTCVYDRDLGKNPRLTRCTDCTDCEVRRNEDRWEDTVHVCGKCSQCILDIPDIDSGDCGEQIKTLVCKNLNTCSSCVTKKANQDILFDVLENTCNSCYLPNDPLRGGCNFYTRIPYKNDTINKKISRRPEVVTYNCAGTQS